MSHFKRELMEERTKHQQRLNAVGQAALEDSRTKLMMSYRFLDAALWRMPMRPAFPSMTLSTDGKTLYFNGLQCARSYRDESAELVRDMLHSILHCVFRHPFNRLHPNRLAWTIACDIATEAAALDMAGTRYPSAHDAERKFVLECLSASFNVTNPNLIYREFEKLIYDDEALETFVFGLCPLRELKQLFERDDHAPWAFAEENDDDEDSKNSDSGEDRDNPTGQDPQDDDQAQGDDESDAAGIEVNDDAEKDREDDDEAERAWEKIAQKIESEMESFSSGADEAGTMLSLLKLSNRRKVDYADFLRRFATMGEELKLNDEEFDNIFYTYGLKLYDNMPLIEPLEYRETYRVREFVIAIDTSGSCEGELVKSFLERTYEILRNSEEFGSTVDIHIIQCDARVQSDVRVTSLEELQKYGDEFEVKGLGGTDFQPVFAYVDDLQAQGELRNLKGLIYFTDGQGTFPKRKPPYETAFVFMDDTPVMRRVPPWAMKVVVDSEGVRAMAPASRREKS